MVFLVIIVIGRDLDVIVLVVFIVMFRRLFVGMMWDIRLVCFVFLVFIMCLVRYMFIVLVLLMVCGRCCVLLVFGMILRLIFGWLNFVVLDVMMKLYIIVIL